MIVTTAPRHVHVEHVLGTVVSLDVRGAGPHLARRATARLSAWLHDAELAGLPRGQALQRGAEILEREGLTDFLLTTGDDVLVRGGALPERAWRVGIQDPRDALMLATSIDATDLAVATAHDGARSVTVVGPDLARAHAHATAALALGLDGPAWTRGLRGYEALTILANEQVLLTTPGFPELQD